MDIVTVGAFTKHTGKTKTGGLIKLLHQVKDHTPTRAEQIQHKVQSANDVVQSIKQLRKEIVDIMTQILLLAKTKSTKNMLPLCNEMMNKTRSLLNIWEPSLVENAFRFIEQHRIIDEPENTRHNLPLSPFKKITQQLCALDLKSPELEDFGTPMGRMPDLWPNADNALLTCSTSSKTKSSSKDNINEVLIVSNSSETRSSFNSEKISVSLPPMFSSEARINELKFNETHFDINGEVTSPCEKKTFINDVPDHCQQTTLSSDQLLENKNELLSSIYDENGYLIENTSIVLNQNGAFLDTKAVMSSDFYRPCDEIEPLDLTVSEKSHFIMKYF